MALAVLDGNQSATTLSSVVTGGEHIVAHSVVSLGSNAISNITTAVSGSVVTIPNLNVLARSVATEGIVDGTLNFVKIGGHQDGSNQTAHIVHVSGGGAMKVDASDSTVTFGAIRGTVTIGNTVTIAGTVTANPTGTQTIAGTVTANAVLISPSYEQINAGIAGYIGDYGALPISGTVTANGIAFNAGEATPDKAVWIAYNLNNTLEGVSDSAPLPISGTVTANAFGLDQGDGTSNAKIPIIGFDTAIESGNSGYVVPVQISNTLGAIGASNALRISGTVTVGNSVTISSLPALAAGTAQIGSVTASISNSVTIGSLPTISGTVTANSSNGSLTTRFGSVTTANTSFATSAVTNANRKYLLIQNITTASNVITVGVGFTPTTTQGIQLTAGAGLTFEGNYIPTGAVNLLSSVTASCFTILEA